MIDLFAHNQIAYESAVAMLDRVGKAAIVHPTGTGKSFIGFKLCEDNADKTVCWLSPSEYIFKTQLENLTAISGYKPQNVVFFTYAKLMLMSPEEIADISPDYIIFDEFHRCGAECWGAGVQTLLDTFPETPILGLSATNILYLDNQRDMADELFDGNIASEMTLGEAIVRGILNPPKYVLSVYSYQKDLEEYERRVYRAKSRAVRDAGEKYLDALRRTIEMADGLDKIFDKHMIDRTGKYIVFCASKEHMDEMQTHVQQWFSRVDASPHIYTVYTEDPTAGKSFQMFKKDNDTTHLRLLFAIDALNEGVHVEDVSGVILLRPTVSPIIYKQQIGRALSASKKKEPIIFDIVNNIENLYSIGTVEEEMRAAVTYYRYFGQGEQIVNERFSVYDEVRDCKRLFEELEGTLSASWDYMYEQAMLYHKEHGHLEIPKRYKTSEGYSLGAWIQTQRKVRTGLQFGNLDETRIAKLDAIGMRWESVNDLSWSRFYGAAQAYVATYGDLNVKTSYVTEDGIRLGVWLVNIRKCRQSGVRSEYLTEERVSLLDELGMIWDQPDYIWSRNFGAAMEYHRLHGDLDVPTKGIVNGVKLGLWIRSLRTMYKNNVLTLSADQIAQLNALGMCWQDKNAARWEMGYEAAKAYAEAHGDLIVPASYKEGVYPLGTWLIHQRVLCRDGKLSPERIEKLDGLGMKWADRPAKHRADVWESCYALAKQFHADHGHIQIPPDYRVADVALGKWLEEQKQIVRGKKANKALSQEQMHQFEALGMDWRSKSDQVWDARCEELTAWCHTHGSTSVPQGTPLSNWLNTQRRKYKQGKLTKRQIEKLFAVGITWETDTAWEVGLAHAEAYIAAHPGEDIPARYVCEDGYKLGNWWQNQVAKSRESSTQSKLTDEQIKQLEAIGLHINESKTDRQWRENFTALRDYMTNHGEEPPAKSGIKSPNGTDLAEWLRTQRIKYRANNLGEQQVAQLNSIPVDWFFPAERNWEDYYDSAKRFYETNGHLDVPTTYRDESGRTLGLWVKNMRASRDKLTPTWANGDKRARLEQIGMIWDEGKTAKVKNAKAKRDHVSVAPNRGAPG